VTLGELDARRHCKAARSLTPARGAATGATVRSQVVPSGAGLHVFDGISCDELSLWIQAGDRPREHETVLIFPAIGPGGSVRGGERGKQIEDR